MPHLSLLLAVAGYLAAPPHPGQHQAPTPSRVLWIGAQGCVFYTVSGELRALPLTDEYRLGGPDDWGHLFNEYPFQAVRAGDWAFVRINHVRGRAVCSGVSIVSRPGGRVPPRGDGQDDVPYHVQQNAANDKEKADRDIRIAWRLAGEYKPPPRKKKPAAEPQP